MMTPPVKGCLVFFRKFIHFGGDRRPNDNVDDNDDSKNSGNVDFYNIHENGDDEDDDDDDARWHMLYLVRVNSV